MNEAPKPTGYRVRRWFWRGLVLSLPALAAWKFIDFGELGRSLLGVDLGLLVLLFFLATIDRFLMAQKWLQLLRAVDLTVRFWTVLSAYYQSALIGRVLPTSLSGDILRGYILSAATGAWEPVLATMLIEKAVALLASVVLATLGIAFLWADLANKEASFLVWVVPTVAVLAFAAFLVSLSRTLLSRILRFVPWQAVKRPAAKLFEAYSVFRSHRTVIAENFLLALLEQSVQIAILLGCAFAIGVEAVPSLLIAVLILSQFLRKLAIVLESWTLGEFTLVLTCALAGIDETDALTFSLLAHAVQITASLPGGVLFWRNREHYRRHVNA